MKSSTNSIGLSLAIALAASSPLAAHAEGAVKLLECEVVRVCDAGGGCEPGSGNVSFRMEPEELATGGAGNYRIRYGEREARMQAISEAGPFLWTVGSQRDVLIASSETEWLWHQLELEPAPTATVRFLVCSLQQ